MLLGAQACSVDGSDVGGLDGITVDVPPALFVTTGHLAVGLCDSDGHGHGTGTATLREDDRVSG